jgi:hypothetical protein
MAEDFRLTQSQWETSTKLFDETMAKANAQ